MEIKELAEIKLARKVIKNHSLSIPFDLDSLVREYADLMYKRIPIDGVDGVSLNLKTPGQRPTIIVNSDLPQKRQLFTLAHELGHIIIPWHIGTIIDNVGSEAYRDFVYSQLEQEANRFAAELLMPKDWILSEWESHSGNLADFHEKTAKKSGASDHATIIQLMKYLPREIVYIAEEYGLIIHTGKTNNSYAHLQLVDNKFSEDFYPHIKNYSTYQSSSINYHWYELNSSIEINSEDGRSWREILNGIVDDIKPNESAEKFKKSINGIMAFAHGMAKREKEYNLNTIISACIYKLNRSGLEDFTSHPDFEIFVKNRAKDFLN